MNRRPVCKHQCPKRPGFAGDLRVTAPAANRREFAMKTRIPILVAALLSATCLSHASPSAPTVATASQPAPGPTLDQAPFVVSFDSEVTVRHDRTVVEITTRRIKVQLEAAIQTVGQQRLVYTEGLQVAEVLEAYTLRPDGRRIDVDPTTIITSD